MNDRLESVVCFRCNLPGRQLYQRGEFGVVKCPRCGQVFISPRLREEAARELYDDPGYYEKAEGGVYGTGLATKLQRTWAQGRLQLITQALGTRPAGHRLLEVGCAYGLFLDHARARGFEVTGLEYSRAGALHTREKLGITVYEGAIEEQDIPAGSFDVVCFWDVIEHVRDPASFLGRVAHVLKPGGVVAWSCPYFTSVPAKVFRARWWTLRPTEHIWHFTPHTVRRAFVESGLPVERIVVSPLTRGNLTRLDSLVGIARKRA